jgi:hypothetical protein
MPAQVNSWWDLILKNHSQKKAGGVAQVLQHLPSSYKALVQAPVLPTQKRDYNKLRQWSSNRVPYWYSTSLVTSCLWPRTDRDSAWPCQWVPAPLINLCLVLSGHPASWWMDTLPINQTSDDEKLTPLWDSPVTSLCISPREGQTQKWS